VTKIWKLWTNLLEWIEPTPEAQVLNSLNRLQARMDSLEKIVLAQSLQRTQPVETLAAQPVLDDRPLDEIPDAHLGAF
jgi:hypothetical protein